MKVSRKQQAVQCTRLAGEDSGRIVNEEQTLEIISVVRIGEWQVLEVRFTGALRPVEMVGLLKFSFRLVSHTTYSVKPFYFVY